MGNFPLKDNLIGSILSIVLDRDEWDIKLSVFSPQ